MYTSEEAIPETASTKRATEISSETDDYPQNQPRSAESLMKLTQISQARNTYFHNQLSRLWKFSNAKRRWKESIISHAGIHPYRSSKFVVSALPYFTATGRGRMEEPMAEAATPSFALSLLSTWGENVNL